MSNLLKIVTTSWDDGHRTDLRLAEVLAKHGIRGTFYIPRSNVERSVMTASEIRGLSSSFEIGGHTLTHANLGLLDRKSQEREIAGCHTWLSETTGKIPFSFAYPGGYFQSCSADLVRGAGFKYARTVQMLRLTPMPPLKSPTTLQVYPHRRAVYYRNSLKRRDVVSAATFTVKLGGKTDLGKLTEHFLQRIEEEGGVFHLWGHSWEIEQFELWGLLDGLLRQVSRIAGFVCCTNEQMISRWMAS